MWLRFQRDKTPSVAIIPNVEEHFGSRSAGLPYFALFSARFRACLAAESGENPGTMLSHVVILWTDPAKPGAADAVIAGAHKYLEHIPGITHFHAGKMVGSHRPVVDQTYQVALNVGFASKEQERAYQEHPQHHEFIEHCIKPFVKRVVVYDFE
jgi:hypothetical protein